MVGKLCKTEARTLRTFCWLRLDDRRRLGRLRALRRRCGGGGRFSAFLSHAPLDIAVPQSPKLAHHAPFFACVAPADGSVVLRLRGAGFSVSGLGAARCKRQPWSGRRNDALPHLPLRLARLRRDGVSGAQHNALSYAPAMVSRSAA